MADQIPHLDNFNGSLTGEVARIAHNLVWTGPMAGKRPTHLRALLQRVLKVTTTAEQQIADQARRIERLEELVITDELTCVLNRRGFQQSLERLVASAERYGHHALLGYVDLDCFKLVNDAHGHPVGDLVLKHVASYLSSQLRPTDFIGRLGGDEFGVALVQTARHNGCRRLSQLCRSLNRSTVTHGRHRIPCQVSFGIAAIGPGCNVDDVLSQADRSMYRRKRRRLHGANARYQHAR